MEKLHWTGIYWEGTKPILNSIKIKITDWNKENKKIGMAMEGTLQNSEEVFPKLVDFYFEGKVDFDGLHFFDYTEQEILGILQCSKDDISMVWENNKCIVDYLRN